MWNPLMKFTAGKMTPPQMRFTAWELGTGYATCLQKKQIRSRDRQVVIFNENTKIIVSVQLGTR